ncbi:MAG: hypothetical protein GTO24_02530 [candidate division Zixibacteria bacterium]|nr:hypothetical protein [candidate division Zixibacteria bacterium]
MVSFNSYRCDSAYMDIYLARVNTQGEVLDTNGFPVCTAEGDQYKSKVCQADAGFMVVWQDERDFESTGYDVYGARVTSNGTVLDPQGIEIAHSNLWEKSPDVGWVGETALAIWEQGNYLKHWDILGVRVDTSGEVLDSTSLFISTACDAQLFGNSDWCGSSYMVVWEEGGDLYGTRSDHLGNVLDSATLHLCTVPENQGRPDLIWGEENFFAVWEDFRNLNFDIYGARIDSGGMVVDASGLPIQVDPATDQRRPAIAFDGGNYLVVWQEMLDSTEANYRIEALRVSSEGMPLDPQPLLLSQGDKGSFPDLSFGGGTYLAVWLDANFWDIHGALIDPNGTVSPTIGIRIAGGLQENPAVASDGDDFLVVWQDCGTHWPDADIVATRVTSSGEVLDFGGIIISMTAEAAEELPSVTFDGINYVVAWRRTTGGAGELRASRVRPDGVVLDPDGISISDISPYSDVSISSGPLSSEPVNPKGQSLLLYSKYRSDPYNSLRMCGSFFWGEPEPNFPPQPFSLLLPADQDTVISPAFLDWEDALDPNASDQVSYIAYVSTSQHFTPESTLIVGDLAESECYVSLEPSSLPYWWRVKAQDMWGEGSWSDQTWSFDLENYGDANGDGKIDAGDAIYLLNYLFRQGPPPEPLAAGDINGDCEVSASDVIYIINYLFRQGPAPQAGCA